MVYNAPLHFIDKAEVKRYAGLGATKFDEKMIDAVCLEAQIRSRPNGIWQVYDYDASSGQVQSTPLAYIKGNKIRKHLNHAEKIIFLAITIGEEVENSISTHFAQGSYSYSVLLDAAATTAVENTADSMEKAIQQYFNKLGYRTLMRFSPGYGEWDITFQHEMMRLSQAAKIDMKLTESCMLIPRKSITAVIGVVPNQMMYVEPMKKTCKICEKKDCLARKEN